MHAKKLTQLQNHAMMGVPVIAIANTDNDVSTLDYPVMANDNSRKSVDFFLKQFAEQ
jgi:ribosomal protein S2